MDKILTEFMDRILLEPCHSGWGSPCFVVPKQVTGEWGLVVDCHGLSAQMQHLCTSWIRFVLCTDTSNYAIRAVLKQLLDDGGHGPVAFSSRVLARSEADMDAP